MDQAGKGGRLLKAVVDQAGKSGRLPEAVVDQAGEGWTLAQGGGGPSRGRVDACSRWWWTKPGKSGRLPEAVVDQAGKGFVGFWGGWLVAVQRGWRINTGLHPLCPAVHTFGGGGRPRWRGGRGTVGTFGPGATTSCGRRDGTLAAEWLFVVNVFVGFTANDGGLPMRSLSTNWGWGRLGALAMPLL